MQGQSGVTRPDVTQELVPLLQSPPEQPVPHRGVETHQGGVPPEHQDVSDGLILKTEISIDQWEASIGSRD